MTPNAPVCQEPRPGDEDLVARHSAGEVAALDALYDRHADAVLALLARIVDDRAVAEELLQETYLRLWCHAGAYRETRGQVRPWLLTIAHRLALNELRRVRRAPARAAPRTPSGEAGRCGDGWDRLADPAPEPAEAAWIAVPRDGVAEALGCLPLEQRAVPELYAAGYSRAEIAARLGQPLGTVKSGMRRGLVRLRELLAARGFDGGESGIG